MNPETNASVREETEPRLPEAGGPEPGMPQAGTPEAGTPEGVRPPASRPRPDGGTTSPSPGRGLTRVPRFSWTVFAYLLRGLAVNTLVAFLILEVVQGIVLTVRATEGYSFDFLIIFPVLLRAFGQALVITVPVSLLFGTGLLMGRLNADRETIALRGFGMSSWQVVAPAAALGGVLSVGSLLMSWEVSPRLRFANRHVGTLILEHLGYLGEGWNLEYRGGSRNLWIHHYDGPFLEKIFLSLGADGDGGPIPKDRLARIDSPAYPVYLFADSARVYRGTGKQQGQAVVKLQGVNLFVDNDFFSPGQSSDLYNLLRFEELGWTPRLSRKAPGVKDLPRGELAEETRKRRAAYDAAAAEGRPAAETRKLWLDYSAAVAQCHRRLTYALATLLFPVAAAMIGLLIRSPNRLLPFFVSSSAVTSVFFLGEFVGNQIAEAGHVPWAMEHLGAGLLVLLIAGLVGRTRRGWH